MTHKSRLQLFYLHPMEKSGSNLVMQISDKWHSCSTRLIFDINKHFERIAEAMHVPYLSQQISKEFALTFAKLVNWNHCQTYFVTIHYNNIYIPTFDQIR